MGTAIGALLCALAGIAPAAALSVTSLFPAAGAADVCADAPLKITFATTPTLGTSGAIRLVRLSDGAEVKRIDLSNASPQKWIGDRSLVYSPVIIDGNMAQIDFGNHVLQYGESYSVSMDPGVLTDAAGTPFDGLARGEPWSFTIRKTPPERASTIRVDADGSADFCTVQGAVDFVPEHNDAPVTIQIAPGTYREIVVVPAGRNRIAMTGAGADRTTIACLNNDRRNSGTNGRFMMGVYGDDFRLSGVTLHNTTPKGGSQAEALRMQSQRSVLSHCVFRSYQDTLQLSGRVYVRDCFVEGDVDFVWGSGAVLFNNCDFYIPYRGYLVQARNDPGQYGYIFVNCRLRAAADVKNYILARIDATRFPGSNVGFIDCTMGDFVDPAGWLITRATDATTTASLRFWEYGSIGPDGHPIDITHRQPLSRQLTPAEAAKLRDPATVLAGDDGWNPTGGQP